MSFFGSVSYTHLDVYKRQPLSSSEAQKQWQKISRQTRMEKSHSKDSESEGEQIMMRELSAKRSRRSYKEFLRRFAVLREEVHADYDSFDMGYYAYGLSLYGNMPLIEPLETRETYKIRDFVIVLDTSYSVSGELVEHFLQETFTTVSYTHLDVYKRQIMNMPMELALFKKSGMKFHCSQGLFILQISLIL